MNQFFLFSDPIYLEVLVHELQQKLENQEQLLTTAIERIDKLEKLVPASFASTSTKPLSCNQHPPESPLPSNNSPLHNEMNYDN